jgi:hypothetical protein
MPYDVHIPVEACPRYPKAIQSCPVLSLSWLLPDSWIVDISSNLDTRQEMDQWKSKGIPHGIKVDVRHQLHQTIVSDQNRRQALKQKSETSKPMEA